MTATLTALASENLNPSLRSLLEDVQRGHIRVPRFQRPFVWTDSQRLDLLRSVRDSMPIGSLLVWRTAMFKLASFPNVGPHSIPPISDRPPAIGWQYLLDGHQRVSTLLGLLLAPQEGGQLYEDDEIDWDIQYNLHEEDFVFAGIGSDRVVRPLLPLWTLFDGRLVNKHMRDLRKDAVRHNWTEEELALWENRADQLAYQFQQCRIPIVVMVSDDLELAARTFQKINSLGTPMGEAHLVAALTWRADFDLRERVDQFRSMLPLGWREVDEGLFLQVCKGLLGLDMTKAAQAELVRRLKDDPEVLERAGRSLVRSVEWLASEMGVVREELLPYALQLVFISLAFDKATEDSPSTSHLAHWFWRTSWSEVFASAAYRSLREEQVLLLGKGETEAEWMRVRRLPPRFDFRSARVRLFMLRLAQREDLTDATGALCSGISLLSEYGRDSLVRMFSAPRGASPKLKFLIQGPGNRLLLDPNTDRNFVSRLMNGPEFPAHALSSHFIEPSDLQFLKQGDVESFLEVRAARMEEWDRSQWISFASTDLFITTDQFESGISAASKPL